MLIDQIRKDSITARKDRSPTASFLTTLLSEITMRAKDDGDRSPTDEDSVKVIQRFLKSATETKELLEARNSDTMQSNREIEVLNSYLPQVLDATQTKDAVQTAVSEVNATSIKDMGKVVAVLKQRYGTALDMKVASQIIKSTLSGN